MDIAKICKFLLAVVSLVMFSSAAAAAQYTIIRADYGYGGQRIDVTQRLREVVSTHSRFRMGNSTFGIDPSPGNVKSLRILARGPQGETRTFEYRESSTIDGSQFLATDRGDGGEIGGDRDRDRERNRDGDDRDSGEYVILHAEYGTEWHHVDVTDRLRELARADRVFRMGNSTFDVDPDPGRLKMLRIYTRGSDGQERMFEYREGSTIDGSQFRGWGRGDWGHDGWNGAWEGAGGSFRGDHDADDSGQYLILRAEYGTDRRHVDVTDRLRELARSDRNFRMGNSTFGIDPDHGRVKTLRIVTRGPDGQERVFEYREGDTVDGSQFKGWSRGDWRQ